ncbi:MAG: twin-arginine translocase TatA/TatE family subunit [Chloroflexi bacterium]|nr:twin-arginine translocase TatA/TatE family subunit [Chloroflexota bacterium]
MDFFDIGPGELLLVIFIALLLWGPRKIPEIARNVGKVVYSFRKAASDFTAEVTREVDATKKDLNLSDDKGKETEGPSHLPPPPKQGDNASTKQ